MVNWKDIHADFTPELQKKWEERGFDYKVTKEWIEVGLLPREHEIAQWVRSDIAPKEIRDRGINADDLREQYNEYLENRVEGLEETQSEYVPSEVATSTYCLPKDENHLDTLARLFTNFKRNKRDGCVAAYLHNEELLIASNREKPDYAKKYLESLQKFIENSNSSENYKKLIEITVEQIHSKMVTFTKAKKAIEIIRDENLKKIKKEAEKYKNNQFRLNELQKLTEKLFKELTKESKKSDADRKWDYLSSWHDTTVIAEAIIKGELSAEIVEAIKKGKIRYIEGKIEKKKNLHAEMKIVEEICKSDEEKREGYIGLTKLNCLDCYAVIHLLNDDGHGLGVCSTHGKTYPDWIAPEVIENKQEKFKEKRNLLKRNFKVIIKETTSQRPEKLSDPVELLNKLELQEQLAQIQISPKGNN